MISRALAVIAAVFASACTDPVITALPDDFTLTLSATSSSPGDSGALIGSATTDTLHAPFNVLVDTGTPLTAYDDGSGKTRGRLGTFTLLAAGDIPRVKYDQVQLFVTSIAPVGFGDSPSAVSGVLGGDNLSRRTLFLDYRSAAPTVAVPSLLTASSCDLSVACQAVLPFALAGGQESIQVGPDLYTYPATRVLLDACLEPISDPISQNVPCATDDPANPPPTRYRYLPSGVEVKMMVATGLPGVIIAKGAYDRLHGSGAGDAILAANPGSLHLPDSPSAVPVGITTLGDGMLSSALALVSHEGTLGPCGELARTRRFRRSGPGDQIVGEKACPTTQACGDRSNPPDNCSDFDDPVPAAAAVIELTKQIPAWVMDDTSDLLAGINADVRPSQPTVEAIIGTEVLQLIVSTIDYPSRRFVARCVSDDDCLTYARFSSEDSPCLAPGSINHSDTAQFRAGGACTPAP